MEAMDSKRKESRERAQQPKPRLSTRVRHSKALSMPYGRSILGEDKERRRFSSSYRQPKANSTSSGNPELLSELISSFQERFSYLLETPLSQFVPKSEEKGKSLNETQGNSSGIIESIREGGLLALGGGSSSDESSEEERQVKPMRKSPSCDQATRRSQTFTKPGIKEHMRTHSLSSEKLREKKLEKKLSKSKVAVNSKSRRVTVSGSQCFRGKRKYHTLRAKKSGSDGTGATLGSLSLPPPLQHWSYKPTIIENYFAKPRRRSEKKDENDDRGTFLVDRPCDKWRLLNNYGFPLDDNVLRGIFDSSTMRVSTPSAHLWHAVVEEWARQRYNPHTKGPFDVKSNPQYVFPGSNAPPPSPAKPSPIYEVEAPHVASIIKNTPSPPQRKAPPPPISSKKLSEDEKEIQSEAKLQTKKRGDPSIAKGFADLGKQVALGVGGVIIDPIRGARQSGVHGFLKGMKSGLVGFVSRPSQGFANLVGSMDRVGRKMSNPAQAHSKLSRLTIKGRFPDQLREELWLAATAASQLRSQLGSRYYLEKLRECHQMVRAAQGINPNDLGPKEKGLERQSRVYHEIVKDLGRTFPSHPFFSESKDSEETTPGILHLRSILAAFSRHRPDIGYCQCLNYIGAVLLLVCEPANAFWILCSIADWITPKDYFSEKLLGAVTDTMVLQKLVARRLPMIQKHVSKLDANLSASCLQWFVCLFVTVFPMHVTIRIWDVVLVHGSHVLFWVALAILHLNQDRILSTRNEGELFSVMASAGAQLNDEKLLVKTMLKCRVTKETVAYMQQVERKALENKMAEKSSNK
mmetsp:Transcript_13992/g.21174  ORF Transcript_13992/g.21174 Transcript_13992/m.21174 type:complete len:805 (+) Transcript_13992:43-2457(+)